MPPPGVFASVVLMDGEDAAAPTPPDLDARYIVQAAARFAGLVLGQKALTVQIGGGRSRREADLILGEVTPLPTLAATVEAAACRLMRQASARAVLGPAVWRELVEAARERSVTMGRTVADVAVAAPLPPLPSPASPEIMAAREAARDIRADGARSILLSAATIAGTASVARTYPGWGPILSGRLMPPSPEEEADMEGRPVFTSAAWLAGLLASGRPSPRHPLLAALAERPEVSEAVAALRAAGRTRASASRAAKAAMRALAPLLTEPPPPSGTGSSPRTRSSCDGAGSMPPVSASEPTVEQIGEAMPGGEAGEGVSFALVREEGRLPAGARIDALREQARPLVRMLRTRLVASRPRPQEPGHRSGLIDQAVLHRLPAGSDRVYIRSPEGGRDRIAVGLLIDGSGSMYRRGVTGDAPWGTSRSHAALVAGYALGQVLATHPRVTLRAWRHTATLPSRGVSSVILTTLRPGEAADWASAVHLPHRENADGEAIRAAAADLGATPAARRILIVVSDGRPHVGQTSYIREAGRAATAAAIRRARREGVEIVGLAISPPDELSDAEMDSMYGPRWLRIDPSQIGGAVAARIARMVEGDG